MIIFLVFLSQEFPIQIFIMYLTLVTFFAQETPNLSSVIIRYACYNAALDPVSRYLRKIFLFVQDQSPFLILNNWRILINIQQIILLFRSQALLSSWFLLYIQVFLNKIKFILLFCLLFSLLFSLFISWFISLFISLLILLKISLLLLLLISLFYEYHSMKIVFYMFFTLFLIFLLL